MRSGLYPVSPAPLPSHPLPSAPSAVLMLYLAGPRPAPTSGPCLCPPRRPRALSPTSCLRWKVLCLCGVFLTILFISIALPPPSTPFSDLISLHSTCHHLSYILLVFFSLSLSLESKLHEDEDFCFVFLLWDIYL